MAHADVAAAAAGDDVAAESDCIAVWWAALVAPQSVPSNQNVVVEYLAALPNRSDESLRRCHHPAAHPYAKVWSDHCYYICWWALLAVPHSHRSGHIQMMHCPPTMWGHNCVVVHYVACAACAAAIVVGVVAPSTSL